MLQCVNRFRKNNLGAASTYVGKRRKQSPTYGQDCPNCQSTNIRKYGNIKNNKPLKCMDCNEIHSLPIYNIINPKLLCLKSYGQWKYGDKNVRRKGDIVNNKQGFLCNDCHRYSALLIYSIIDQKRAASDDLQWHIGVAISALIIVLDVLEPWSGTALQFFTLVFKWVGIIAICIVLLSIVRKEQVTNYGK